MRAEYQLCVSRPLAPRARPFYSVPMGSLVEVSIRDPERALPMLERYFPGVAMSNPHGNFALELLAAEIAPLSVVRYRLRSRDSSSSADLSGNLTFGQVEGGEIGLTASSEQIDTTVPWLFPDERVHAEWDDVTITALTMSKAATVRMARAQLGSDTAAVAFTGRSPIDRSLGRHWHSLVEYTRAALTTDRSPLESPIVLTSAFAHLVGLALETFPNTIQDAVREQSRPGSAPTSLRRAIAFIDENAHLPITSEDIARESRLSIRALQYGFRHHLGVTPVGYLRRVRLDGAHRELKRADPTTGATVTQIATDWGFANAGRFASYYRDVFGVSPKRTLDS